MDSLSGITCEYTHLLTFSKMFVILLVFHLRFTNGWCDLLQNVTASRLNLLPLVTASLVAFLLMLPRAAWPVRLEGA